MNPLEEQPFSLTSEGWLLEGAMHEGTGALAAVVLHPHPQYGGDMDSHVVTSICAALAAKGGATLRFNFRGAGRSEGRFDHGRGEANDARCAVHAMRDAAPGTPLLLAGYSFGAMIAASIADEVHPAAMMLVSPPLGMASLAPLDARVPTLIITGERDEMAPAAAVRALAGGRHRAVVVEGADHSWWPGCEALIREVENFVDSLAYRV